MKINFYTSSSQRYWLRKLAKHFWVSTDQRKQWGSRSIQATRFPPILTHRYKEIIKKIKLSIWFLWKFQYLCILCYFFKKIMFYILILFRLSIFLCIQFVIISFRELSNFSLSLNLNISYFSSSHRWQFPYRFLHILDFLMIFHLICGVFDSCTSFQ